MTADELSGLFRDIFASNKFVESSPELGLWDMCEIFLQKARIPFQNTKEKIEKGQKLEEEDGFLLHYALHTLRSSSAGYCVFGDYDKALEVLDELTANNQFIRENMGSMLEQERGNIEDILDVPIDDIKAAISVNQGVLPAFFQRLSYDPQYMQKMAQIEKESIRYLEGNQELPDFPREEFRAIVDKHLKRAGIKEEHIDVLGTYFTDGFALEMVDQKKRINRVQPKAEIRGVTSNPQGYPTLEGGDVGFASVEGIDGYSFRAMGAIDFYGRFPEGEFMRSVDVRDAKVAEAVRHFSFDIANRAAKLAQQAGRKKVEEDDVIRAYDQVPNGGRPEVHEQYQATKSFTTKLTRLAKSDLSSEEFTTGVLALASKYGPTFREAMEPQK